MNLTIEKSLIVMVDFSKLTADILSTVPSFTTICTQLYQREEKKCTKK